jgi:uncharacterized protein (DUF924 family)
MIGKRFKDLHEAASNCELFEWRKTPEGRLAEISVLDQFSRNMYRDTALSFATVPLALALAQEAKLNQNQRSFCTCRLCTVRH